jgi:hypothetical protein
VNGVEPHPEGFEEFSGFISRHGTEFFLNLSTPGWDNTHISTAVQAKRPVNLYIGLVISPKLVNIENNPAGRKANAH